MLELLERLDRRAVAPVFASMSAGPVADAVAALGIPTRLFDAPEEIVSADRSDLSASPSAPVRLARRFKAALPVIREISAFLKSENISVIYTNSSKAHILGGLAGRRAKIRVIWHFRDYFPGYTAKFFFSQIARHTADTVICNSEFTAGQFGGHGDCRVVLNGLPVERVRATRSAATVKAELGLPEDCKVAGTAGRLESWKGIHTFVRAAGALAVEFTDARFVVAGAPIYGNPGYVDELKSLAASVGAADRVVFTGHRNDIFDVINAYDVYVHPSVQPEPFGRGIVEAMLLGKPVVASASGGPMEIVAGGSTGLFFLPGDTNHLVKSIASLLRDPERAAAFGAAGRRRAESLFNAHRSVKEIANIILETNM